MLLAIVENISQLHRDLVSPYFAYVDARGLVSEVGISIQLLEAASIKSVYKKIL
jgi:hypothetical protein